jgi:hypothetical protein
VFRDTLEIVAVKGGGEGVGEGTVGEAITAAAEVVTVGGGALVTFACWPHPVAMAAIVRTAAAVVMTRYIYPALHVVGVHRWFDGTQRAVFVNVRVKP